MTCPHDIVERDIAVSDGYCPLCLVADNQRLRAALEPFAKIEYPPACPDGTWVAKTTFCNNQLTAFQIRRARAALQPKEGEK